MLGHELRTNGDSFGASVAGDVGDIDRDGIWDIVVGAETADDARSNGGRLYVIFLKGNDAVKGYTVINQLPLGGLGGMGLF